MPTKVISFKEFKENQAKYFDLAEKERIVIKKGEKKINLTIDDDELVENTETWFNEFFAIPEAYRCNPYDVSPSGDLFYADKRNVEHLQRVLNEDKGTVICVKTKDELKHFLESL